MDDVIFAGTADRPALGRAEVSLTIDNTAGLLPIEFSEVTITRMLFRTGDSEYQINGAPCRLLDIQELLSDTGIGRQQHVIVGQGQLDTVLNARPEERRAIIEEAAGILKFRKRREKAQRRLEATEGNLLRLTDLLREVRRQLRPLERQADAARRHDGLVAELHAITLHLAGRELDTLRTREERRREQRTALHTHDQELKVRLRRLDDDVLAAEHAIAIPGDDDVADLLTRAEALRERARGVANLVAERQRGFERELAAVADEGVVETLVAEAASVREQLAAVDADFASLAPTRSEVEAAEQRLAALQSGPAAADAEVAHRDATRDLEQLEQREAALGSEIAVTQEQLTATARELDALGPQSATAEAAEADAARVRAELEEHAYAAPEMAPEAQARRAAEEQLHDADGTLREREADAHRWLARAETLRAALDATPNNGVSVEVDGVLGPLADHIRIDAGAELAVTAALGDALHAVVVRGDAAARRAIERLKAGDDTALLLVAGSESGAAAATPPPGTRAVRDFVRGDRPELDVVLAGLLARFVVVDGDWRAALDMALDRPGVVAVTRDGDRFGGASPWRAGWPGAPVVTAAALAEAEQRAADAAVARDDAQATVELARQALAAARRSELVATERGRTRRKPLEELTAHRARLRRDVEVKRASLEERDATL